MNIDIYNTT